MEKEFEALNYLYNDLRLMKCLDVAEEAKVKSAYECLQKALTELKAIKEAKPSEALKCVDVLKEDGCITTLYQGDALETIRQTLLKQLSGSQYTNIAIDEAKTYTIPRSKPEVKNYER